MSYSDVDVYGLRAILAVSNDGFVATGPNDDMKWTGPLDKAFFKLFTLTNSDNCFVGKKTADLMPKLPGRNMWKVRTSLPPNPYNLDGWNSMTKEVEYEAMKEGTNDGICLGGPSLIRSLFDDKYITELVVCRIKDVNLGSGIPFDFDKDIASMKKFSILKSNLYSHLEVDLYRIKDI